MIWYWLLGVTFLTIVVSLIAGAIIHWADREDEL